jgi:NADP-dependent aldehyde dehydrogenase
MRGMPAGSTELKPQEKLMPILGELLIGSASARGFNGSFSATAAHSGEKVAPEFGRATTAQLEQACALAWQAFDLYRETSLEARAAFLETIAQNILEIGDELIQRCMVETGLPRPRLEGERGRTVAQLRLFADVVREGSFLEARIDPAQPTRRPIPRVEVRLRNIALGPVAVFGASNFPLAFSVAGGDTASALAAGCPVIVKAHSAHPGTSELVGRAVQAAAKSCGMPEGTFSLLFDSGRDIGQGLVADWRIKAVGFTGSRAGGTALMKIAATRAEPIPVYAEMSSVNPVLLFPHALASRGEAIGKAFIASLTMGAGQFCTNPGLVLAVDCPALDGFIEGARAALAEATAGTMLTPGIHKAYCSATEKIAAHPEVETIGRGKAGSAYQGQAALFSTTARAFLAHPELQEEMFGAASLIVRCRDLESMRQMVENLEGQLTAALHIDEADHEAARAFVPTLERKAGRILVNGFGTGVEVAHAMVHGGPYPSTSDGRSTSVGSLAIFRFLRPVCYQDMPAALLPDPLKDDNPYGLVRRIDGKLECHAASGSQQP